MALRKASSYSKKRFVPYTRHSKVKSKAYIKTVPQQKIVKFTMGSVAAFNRNEFLYVLHVKSKENVLIRDNALESARVLLTKELDTHLQGQYYFALKVFPHHILRENKMLTGAGADRMQTGMQLSFGSVIGRAAIVKKGAEIFLFATNNEKNISTIRLIIDKIRSKLPCKISVEFEKLG
ncbi:50S ribosomal protein L16 [Candidatus Pacearchaeota archaeon]|nr:50S ribosomal protein L16 [Candidatus Pacearchaeota archaeon]